MAESPAAEAAIPDEIRKLRAQIAELERERQVLDRILEQPAVMASIVRASDFIYERVNPAFQALAPGKQLIGRRFAEVWAGVSDPFVDILRNVVATGNIFHLENAPFTIRRRPDGPLETFYVSCSWIPLAGPDGKPDRILSLAHETTGAVRQQQVEEALRAESQVIEAVINHTPACVAFLRGRDLRFQFVNPAYQAIAPGKQILGKTLEEVWPEVYPALEQIFNRVLETGEPYQVVDAEYIIRRTPAGPLETAYFSWFLTRVPLSGEEGWGLLNTAIETTALVRAREAVEESERRFSLMFEKAAYAIVLSRLTDGTIVKVNEAWIKAFGYSKQEAIGKTGAELNINLDQDLRKRLLAELEERGFVRDVELNLLTKSGETRIFSGNLDVVEMAGQKYVLSSYQDVTDRKRAEARIRDAQKLESLGLLAGGVAHDFNNLLVGIIGNASLAQEMLPRDHPATELMHTVIRTGEQAARLTRQMLAYSGKGRFVLELVSLSDLIPEMASLVRASISKKIALHLDLHPKLPSVEADRGQVNQVFMNLVLNAAEAVGSHDGLITVRTGVQVVDEAFLRLHPASAELPVGEYVFLQVHDTGCGMDDAIRARIFDPFFSTKFTGRGLGLAAVAGIVRGHKGAIVVESVPGTGSSFTVLFPSSTRTAEQLPDPAPRMALQGSGVVLVVDDEEVVREAAKKALERLGYTVLLADGGPAAIDVFRRYPTEITLVVLDLSMPCMSGEETLPELRKIRPEARIIISSGYSESEIMTLFRGQPISGYLQKPYTATGIAEKVKLALS